MIRRVLTSLFLLFAFVMIAQAQVGYQVSLLNTATGEPRANVTVNAQVTITDSQDKTIYNGTQKATSNDFGVLSLTVGDANTFAEAGTSKWPLFISVTVDGTLIGKSQILSVPIAEVANNLKSSFTKEDLIGTWVRENNNADYSEILTFKEEEIVEYVEMVSEGIDGAAWKSQYVIFGNDILIIAPKNTIDYHGNTVLKYYKSKLYWLDWDGIFVKQ